MNKLTIKQMTLIAQAFGINLFNAILSHKLKDKILPNEFYRNRFQEKYNEEFEKLISIGFANKTMWQDLPFYYVNEIGEKQFRKQFSELVNYKPTKLRDLNYLKCRINFYCEFYNYHFCDDNSEHIIDAYLNYWVKKHRVSHTTEDTIKMFKNELKSYYKKGLLKI